MSLETVRSVPTKLSGPPVAIRARGPGREFSHFSPKPPVRVTPSFRNLDSRSSTPRLNSHSNPNRSFESPRFAARRGLELRSATYRPNLDVPRLNSNLSFVHTEAQLGREPLGRLVTPDVKPARIEAQHDAVRPGEFRAPSLKVAERQALRPRVVAENVGNNSTDYSLRTTEIPHKPTNSEIKIGQIEAKAGTLKTAENERKTIKNEYKKFSTYSQNLAEIFATTEPLILAPRPGVLARRDAEIQGVEYRVQGAEAPIILSQNQADKALSLRGVHSALLRTTKQSNHDEVQIASLPVVARNDILNIPRLQDLPKITIETNQGLQQVQETVKVLAPEIASLPVYPERSRRARNDVLTGLGIVTGAEARAALMIGETPQVQRAFEATQTAVIQKPELQPQPLTLTSPQRGEEIKGSVSLDPIEVPQLLVAYQALLPALGQEKALNLVSQSVEKRVQMLNQAQKMALAEKIINETEPEELLEGLSDDEKWRVEVFVKKIIHEKQIQQKVVVWEPGMRARRGKIRSALGHLEPGQVISGVELVSKIGPQTSDEIGPINPEGLNSGGGDQFRAAIMEGEFTKEDLGLVIGISEDYPTLEVVEEEVIATRQATDEEIHEEVYGRYPQIVAFARRQAIKLLANLAA